MKKHLLSILFLSLSAIAFAQPQANTLPAAGDSVSIFEFDASGWTNAGPSGANVTWDFSGITLSPTPSFVIKMKAASAAPQFNKYPAAELAGEMWFTGVPFAVGNLYYDITANTLSALGEHSNFNSDFSVYTDPESDLTLPITYQETLTDTYREVEYYDTDSTVSTGTKNFLVDGYGTLKLPGRTLQNVLRIRVIDQSQETEYTDGQPQTTTTTDTSYHWRVQGFAYDVLHVSDVNSSDREGQVSWPSASTGISAMELTHVNVFPNPAADMISISGLDRGEARITDLSGRLVLEQDLETSNRINVEELENGVYLLHLNSNAGRKVISFIKN